MKYSRTAIGLLTAQYRSVLKKCFLINMGLFALGAVATPANAEYTPVDSRTVVGSEDVSFDNNSFTGLTSASYGGAIYNMGASGDVTVSNSIFKDNYIAGTSSYNQGGAIYINTSSPVVNSITNTVFDGNYTSGKASRGGAIYINNNGTSTNIITNISGSTFTGNKALRSDQPTNVMGSAVYQSGGTLNLTNNTFGGANDGDANEGTSTVVSQRATVNLSGNTFQNNKSLKEGILSFNNVNANGNFSGENNFIDNDGHAVYVFNGIKDNQTNPAGTITFKTGSTTNFTGNSALDDQDGQPDGGAIYNAYNATTTFEEGSTANFTENEARNGGAIFNQSTMTVGGTFTENTATQKGGAIYNSGTLTVADGTVFEGNKALVGAGIYNSGTATLGDNITFHNNELTATENAHGSAIANVSANKVTIGDNLKIFNDTEFATDCCLIYNPVSGTIEIGDNAYFANGADGILSSNDWGSGRATISIGDGATFENMNGAAIVNWYDTDTTIGDNATFTGTKTAIMNIQRSTTTVGDNVTITGNYHPNRGAIYNSNDYYITGSNTKVTFEGDATIKDNNTRALLNTTGGDVIFNGETLMANNKFDGNGGAIANTGGKSTDSSEVIFNGAVSISNNAATGLGGAIYNEVNGVVNFNDSATFSGNKSNVVYDGETITSSTSNDIYNAGVINFNSSADLAGGIDGAAGTVNVNGEGIKVANALKNQTVNVAEDSVLTLDKVADLTGSTIDITTNGGILSTVNNYIDDYSTGDARLQLANNSKIKLDVDMGTSTADKFGVAGSPSTISLQIVQANLMNASDEEKVAQIVDNGITVDAYSAVFADGKGVTIEGTGIANGSVKINQFAGLINKAVELTSADTGKASDVIYDLDGDEMFFSVANPGDDEIQQSNFTIEGNGNTITAAANADAIKITNNSEVTVKDVTFSGFDNGTTDTDKGALNVEAGSTLYVYDSHFDASNEVAIYNNGILFSDPTIYEAQVINSGTATFENDSFQNIATTAITNSGTVNLNATSQDVEFIDNGTDVAQNNGTLNLTATGGNKIVFNNGITGTGTSTINLQGGTTEFNSDVTGNAININNNSTLDLGDGASIDGLALANDANGGTLDLRNSRIDSLGDVTLGSDLNVLLDADLAGATNYADALGAGKAISGSGSMIVNAIELLSLGGATEEVALASTSNAGKITVSDAAKASLAPYYASVDYNSTTGILTLGSKATYASIDLVGSWGTGEYIKAYSSADKSGTSVGANLMYLDTAAANNAAAIKTLNADENTVGSVDYKIANIDNIVSGNANNGAQVSVESTTAGGTENVADIETVNTDGSGNVTEAAVEVNASTGTVSMAAEYTPASGTAKTASVLVNADNTGSVVNLIGDEVIAKGAFAVVDSSDNAVFSVDNTNGATTVGSLKIGATSYGIDNTGAATLASIKMTNNAATPGTSTMTKVDDGNYSDTLATTFATNATVGQAITNLKAADNTWAGTNTFTGLVTANGGLTVKSGQNFTLGGTSVSSVDTAGLARGAAGSATALATTSSVATTITNQAADGTYNSSNTYAANTIGAAIKADGVKNGVQDTALGNIYTALNGGTYNTTTGAVTGATALSAKAADGTTAAGNVTEAVNAASSINASQNTSMGELAGVVDGSTIAATGVRTGGEALTAYDGKSTLTGVVNKLEANKQENLIIAADSGLQMAADNKTLSVKLVNVAARKSGLELTSDGLAILTGDSMKVDTTSGKLDVKYSTSNFETTSTEGLRIKDGGVNTTQIANGAVTLDKVASSAIATSITGSSNLATDNAVKTYVDNEIDGAIVNDPTNKTVALKGTGSTAQTVYDTTGTADYVTANAEGANYTGTKVTGSTAATLGGALSDTNTQVNLNTVAIAGKLSNDGNFTASTEPALIKDKTVTGAMHDMAVQVETNTTDIAGKVDNAGNFTASTEPALIKDKTVVAAIHDTAVQVTTNTADIAAVDAKVGQTTAAFADGTALAGKTIGQGVSTDVSVVSAIGTLNSAISSIDTKDGIQDGALVDLYDKLNGGTYNTATGVVTSATELNAKAADGTTAADNVTEAVNAASTINSNQNTSMNSLAGLINGQGVGANGTLTGTATALDAGFGAGANLTSAANTLLTDITVTTAGNNIVTGANVAQNLSNLDSTIGGAITGTGVLSGKTLGNDTAGGEISVATALGTVSDTIGKTTSAFATGTALGGMTIGQGAAATDVSVVDALGALNTAVKTNSDHIGTVSSLNTTAKTDLVSAVNEVVGDITVGTGTHYYITAGADVAGNLVGLDNQVKANTDAIAGSDAKITSLGNNIGGTWSGDTFTHSDYNTANKNILNTDNLTTAIGKLDTAVGKVATGTYNAISASNDVAANLQALDGAFTSGNIDAKFKDTTVNSLKIGTAAAISASGTTLDFAKNSLTNVQGLTLTDASGNTGTLSADANGISTNTNLDVNGTLTVGSANQFVVDNSGNVNTSGDITTTGDISAKDGTFSGDLGVTGNTTIGGTLSVTGAATVGSLNIGSTGKGINSTGDATLNSLNVAGKGFDSSGNATTGTLKIGDAAVITGTTTGGASKLDMGGNDLTNIDDFSMTGNATIGGTLTAGATTIAATGAGTTTALNVTATDTSGSGSTTTFTVASDKATVGGDFEVTGNTSLKNTTVTGTLTISDGATPTANAINLAATSVNAKEYGGSAYSSHNVLGIDNDTFVYGRVSSTDALSVFKDSDGTGTKYDEVFTVDKTGSIKSDMLKTDNTGNTVTIGKDTSTVTTMNGSLKFNAGSESVNAIDDGTTAATSAGTNNATTMATLASVLKSAENADYTVGATAKNITEATSGSGKTTLHTAIDTLDNEIGADTDYGTAATLNNGVVGTNTVKANIAAINDKLGNIPDTAVNGYNMTATGATLVGAVNKLDTNMEGVLGGIYNTTTGAYDNTALLNTTTPNGFETGATDLSDALKKYAENNQAATGVSYAANGSVTTTYTKATTTNYAGLVANSSLKSAIEQLDGNIGTAITGVNRSATLATATTVSTNTVNANIDALDAAIGNLDYTGGTINYALANGSATDGIKTIVANIGAASTAANGNITSANSVNANLDQLDASIGDRSAIGSKNAAINAGTAANVAAGLKAAGDAIGDMNFGSSHYVGGASDLSSAVRTLDDNMYRIETDLHDVKRDLNRGMASMAAMSALVPNPRAHGNTSLAIGTGAYSGHTAAAIGGFHYITDNIMLNAGAAWGNSRDASYRLGVTFSW